MNVLFFVITQNPLSGGRDPIHGEWEGGREREGEEKEKRKRKERKGEREGGRWFQI